MNKPKTFEYFASEPMDAMDTVFEVADGPLHPEHDNLLQDLNEIPPDELIHFEQEGKYNHLINRRNLGSKERETKLWFMVYYLQKTIARERLLMLAGRIEVRSWCSP